MLYARRAVRNLREIITPQFLLLLHAERAVVRRDDLQVVRLQTLPQLSLIPLLTKRRRHHIFSALKARLFVVVVREKQILRASLSKRRQAPVTRLAHLSERVRAGKM